MKKFKFIALGTTLLVGVPFVVPKANGDATPPSQHVPTLPSYSDDDVKRQTEKAKKGDLAAAQALFAHYCMYTDDGNACDYWTVRSAELGDERMRCSVIERYKEFGMFATYKADIKKLMKKGKCKAPE